MRSPLRSLSARDRRAIIVAAISILAIVLLPRGVPAVVKWRGQLRASATELVGAAGHAVTTIRHVPELQDSLGARHVRLAELGRAFLAGSTHAAIASDLEHTIDRAATRASLTLGSVQIDIDSVSHSDFPTAAIRLQASGNYSQIVGFLRRIEQGPPLLAVREMALTKASADDQPELIRADLLIGGLARPAQSSAQPGGHP